MNLNEELRHLRLGPERDEEPSGLGLMTYVVRCDSNAPFVLARCKEALEVVVSKSSEQLPLDEWRRVLPGWFVSACAEERTREESDRWIMWWRGLPEEQKAQVRQQRAWTLYSWIHWFVTEERVWYWWDGIIEDQNMLIVTVEVWEWPLASGSLRWLLTASGASSIVEQGEG